VLVLVAALVAVISGTDVSVGMSGVCVGVSVGGIGVLVGIAACVSATIVNAAATAVDWISSGLTVGSAGCPPPHALINMADTVTNENTVKRFISF
jgi:hypothetical protein